MFRTLRISARRFGVLAAAGALGFVMSVPTAQANVALRKVSADRYTNTTSFHKTEVEPDTFAFGTTIVSAFQVGRFPDGGASNVGWATSTDGGTTWTHRFLPKTTKFAKPKGPYDRDTDPAVGYDATHGHWMIASLGMTDAGPSGVAILVNVSADGVHWSPPTVVAAATGGADFDKTWVVCDNGSTLFAGHCYVEWDDFGNLDQPHVSTSTDGGLTWTEATVPPGVATGGQPVVQLSTGAVIMPIDDGFEASVDSYVSHDGGVTFAGPFGVSPIQRATVPGGVRAPDLPSAEIDGLGRVYLVWYDCRFRVNCTSNDIVLSTSLDGKSWTPPVAIPIDASTSTADHFLAGIGVDPATSGNTAVLGVTYYFYPTTPCDPTTCQLSVGFISSSDGGLTWGAPVQLAGPITPTWLPQTGQGYMVGDYSSTSYLGGRAHTVFATALPGTCQLGQITSCKEMMVSPQVGLFSAGPTTPVRTVVLFHGQTPHSASPMAIR